MGDSIYLGNPPDIIRIEHCYYDGQDIGPIIQYPDGSYSFVYVKLDNIVKNQKVKRFFGHDLSRLLVDEIGYDYPLVTYGNNKNSLATTIAEGLGLDHVVFDAKTKEFQLMSHPDSDPFCGYSKVAIFTDVFDADKIAEIVESLPDQKKVAIIACVFNGSGNFFWSGSQTPPWDSPIPILSLIDEPVIKYKSDDPEFLGFLNSGGEICVDPETDWPRLQEIMQQT